MSDYSKAIWSLDSVSRSRPEPAEAAEVTSRAALLLPSFGVVVFAVTLLQVLFLAQGAQSLFRDSDTGWHVRNGEAILTTAAVPQVDSFSYTRGGRPAGGSATGCPRDCVDRLGCRSPVSFPRR